jgi:C-terminal processing protease CtpA/Prc
VQTILDIGNYTSLLGSRSHKDGALKLTIQKFYRVAGGSTQLHGVASDIVLAIADGLTGIRRRSAEKLFALRRSAQGKIHQSGASRFRSYLDELKRRSSERTAK